ncbi:MAG: hypothetical protein K2X87_28975 [Gemmataceae bacterium]|nr:hypothetical protein [Gemmataceae bacterium]
MPVLLPADRDRDAWQVAVWNAPDDELSRPQKLELMHMLEAAFNAFDPFRVVADLLAHRGLWDGVVMCNGFPFEGSDPVLPGWHLYGDLIHLRDIGTHRNVDTVYILHAADETDALKRLATGWHADEIHVYAGDAAEALLGDSGTDAAVLRVWWD